MEIWLLFLTYRATTKKANRQSRSYRNHIMTFADELIGDSDGGRDGSGGVVAVMMVV